METSNFSDLSYKKLIILIISIAALFNLGYWSTFGFNIFEYMSIQEVVTSFFYPFIFVALSYFIWSIVNFKTFLSYNPLNFKGQSPVRKLFFIILNLLFLFLLFSMLYWGNSPFAWISVPFLFWVTYSSNIIAYLLNLKIIPENSKIIHSIQFISLIFVLSFFIGKSDGLEVKRNISFDYTQFNNEYYKILGKGGDFLVLESIDNKENVIVELNKITPIKIYHFNRNNIRSNQDREILINILKK